MRHHTPKDNLTIIANTLTTTNQPTIETQNNTTKHDNNILSHQKGYLTGNRCAKCGKKISNKYLLCFECHQKELQGTKQ